MSALEALAASAPPPAPPPAAAVTAQGLYERHSNRILGFCLRRVGTREEAEDALQTTFLQAFRALQRGVVPISEEAWLFKIAENVCLSTHRANGRRFVRETTGELPEIADERANRDGGRELAHELVNVLAGLPVNQRRALLLREWRGLSYREIAGQLGVTVGAVETLIFRGRKRVVRALDGETSVRSRLAGMFDLTSLLGTLKTVFGGATAAKLVATAAVLTIVSLPADHSPAPSTKPTQSVSQTVSSAAVSDQVSAQRTKGNRQTRGHASTSALATGHAGVPQRPTSPTAGSSSAAAPPSGPATPLPDVPKPVVPSLPSSRVEPPTLPVELPSVPAVSGVPALPQLQDLPVKLPDLTSGLPPLPRLP